MSAREVLTHWLGRGAGRLRLNLWLRSLSGIACGLLGTAAVYQLVRVGLGIPAVTVALVPLLVLTNFALVGFFVWRLWQKPSLAQTASEADQVAGLKDELRSALWFAQQRTPAPIVERVIEHASHTVERLDPRRVFPLVLPRGIPVAVVLAVVTGVLASLSPRLSEPNTAPLKSVGAAPEAQRRSPQTTSTAESADAATAAPHAQASWTQLADLVSELTSGPRRDELAQAVAARDTKAALQLIEALRRRQAAQGAAPPAAHVAREQMNATMAADILERLQNLENQGDPSQPASTSNESGGESPTARLTRELREEAEGVQSSRPAQQSENERELNTALRAISRNSTGGRQVVRGETEVMQDAGRTSVGGGGAMGRRINLSQAGGGDGDAPGSNSSGNDESDPVLGKKTARLQTQLQTIKVEQTPNDDDRQGTEDAFYAATQAQASSLAYEAVTARQRGGTEQESAGQRPPLAYRDAIKQYTLSQHRKERATP